MTKAAKLSGEPQGVADMVGSDVLDTLRTERPARVLILSADAQTLPALTKEDTHSDQSFFTLISSSGQDSDIKNGLSCDLNALPFEDDTFNMVIAHHVLSKEALGEIGEIHRVLAGGGLLLVIGRGRFGSKKGVQDKRVPCLGYHDIQRRLSRKAFRISQRSGFGIFGKRVLLDRSWLRPFLPVSDLILIKAKYQSHAQIVTPFRFTSPQAAGVRSATVDSLNREVV